MEKTIKYIGSLMLIFYASVQALAQGVPKAYETINYHGEIHGKLVKFVLADGYIGASLVKIIMPD